MKTKLLEINGRKYMVVLTKLSTFEGKISRFKWYKLINDYAKNLTSKDWIRHLNKLN